VDKSHKITLAAFVAALSEEKSELDDSLQMELHNISTQLKTNPGAAISNLHRFLRRNEELQIAYDRYREELRRLDPATYERSKCLFNNEGTEETPEQDDGMIRTILLRPSSPENIIQKLGEKKPIENIKSMRKGVEKTEPQSSPASSNMSGNRAPFLAWLGASLGVYENNA